MKKTDLQRLSFVMNLLGKRIIPCYFYQKNPYKVTQWQYNMCRQTAIICAMVAERLLDSWGYDGYTVQAWDGYFIDPIQGEYNHAWCFLEHIQDPEMDILIDVARVTYHIGVVQSDNNPVKFLSCPYTGKPSIETRREELNYKSMTYEHEYYTGATSEQIVNDMFEILGNYFKDVKPEKTFA